MQSSYDEKRAFLEPLPPAAGASPAWTSFLAARAAALAAIEPAAPSLAGFSRVADPSQPLACGAGSRLSVAFAADGSLSRLVDVASGHDWVGGAAGGGPLRFSYRSYNEADFAAFDSNYTPGCGVPCINFAKVGLDSAGPVSREWPASLAALYVRQGGGGGGAPACTALAQLQLDPQTVSLYGGAAAIWLRVDIDAGAPAAPPVLSATLTLLNKTRTRMAESAWLNVPAPAVLDAQAGAWRLHVLGSLVDPADVALWGARWLHAVDPLDADSYSFRGAPGGGAALGSSLS